MKLDGDALSFEFSIPILGGKESLGISLVYDEKCIKKIEVFLPRNELRGVCESLPHFVDRCIILLKEILICGRTICLEELSSAGSLDLTWMSDFDRNVYNVLLSGSAGHVYTYSEVAEKAGVANGARAVGNSMRKNRFPILIPCHRVVKSDGNIGGYSAGVKIKKLLLEHEKCLVGKGC